MTSHGIPRTTAIVLNEEATEEKRRKEGKTIKEYRDLVEQIDLKVRDRIFTSEVFTQTSKLLTMNPEYYTIWNVRRRILLHGLLPPFDDIEAPTDPVSPISDQAAKTLQIITADLEFIMPLMMIWQKCYWIWNYRLWLLEQGIKRLRVSDARELWLRELGFVGKMLTKDQRNFHGWGYRRKIVEQLESPKLCGKSMVENEFEYSTRMINVALRNFSAWHHRSKLIPRLLDERRADDIARQTFLDSEFGLILKAIWTDQYPYDQSVWFYHQFLMTTLTEPIRYASIVPNFTAEERLGYIGRQITNIREFLDGGEDCKWAYSALIDATLAVCRMQRRVPNTDEICDLNLWFAEVRKLDPLRNGRWEDVEREVNLSEQLLN